jgi:hypothetical protein
MKAWTASKIDDATYLEAIETSDGLHIFEILRTSDRLVFGGWKYYRIGPDLANPSNAGFIEWGYILRGADETDSQLLADLLADLEVLYAEGLKYASRIVVNQEQLQICLPDTKPAEIPAGWWADPTLPPPSSSEKMFKRIRREIVDDVRMGVVPADVPGFSALHDHVDANCYGGCEELLESLTTSEDDRTAALDSVRDVFCVAMREVDEWIKSGGIMRDLLAD